MRLQLTDAGEQPSSARLTPPTPDGDLTVSAQELPPPRVTATPSALRAASRHLCRSVVVVFTTLSFVGTARAQPPPPDVLPEPGPEPPTTEPHAPADPTAPAEAPPPARAIDVHASSEVAGYADSDHVYVVSPTVAGSVANPTAGWSAGGRYLVDVVSAASVDIVSTASRRWEEVRHAGSVNGSYKPGAFGVSGSGDVSIEPDYQSYTGGISLTQDLLNKNLTLLGGYSYGHDIGGRHGTPFSVFSHKLDIHGFKAGGTVLLDRATVLSVVGDLIFENGDPSKPYRYVPLFAPGTQVSRGASVDEVMQLRTSARVLEQLPLTRNRYALSGRLAHRFSTSTVRLDERGYIDTWGMKATTTDARWLFDAGRFELGPHARVHAQTGVSFWQRAYELRPGFDFPALRTGDRELSPILNLTGGGSVRWHLGPASAPRSWALGLDAGLTWTRYFDALYITQRLSGVTALSLEVDL